MLLRGTTLNRRTRPYENDGISRLTVRASLRILAILPNRDIALAAVRVSTTHQEGRHMTKVTITKNTESTTALPVFDELARRMDVVRQRAFELFKGRGGGLGRDLDDWVAAEREVLGWPAAALKERDGTYEMEIALPGFTPGEVEVTASPNEVIVHAATKTRKKHESENVLWTEFGSNDVYRRFGFPDGIDTAGVTADFDGGLLRVKAPKPGDGEAAAPA
ncbi:MAG: hypothetical protein MNPFHGCM_00485 [Gemmatimonadaceae bacterium]|nr:hypothetical protein [Gemmatimonadaceae bacterium]